ncbi:hypothetical protein D3C83_125320 [compost metagenome]
MASTWTFCPIPLDSAFALALIHSPSPKRMSSSVPFARAAALLIPFRRPKYVTRSIAFMFLYSPFSSGR